jgi:hypothetical protein
MPSVETLNQLEAECDALISKARALALSARTRTHSEESSGVA